MIYRSLTLINLALLGIFDFFRFLDLLLLILIFYFFYLMWRGKLWPRYWISGIVFVNQALFLLTIVLLGQPLAENTPNIVSSVGLVVIAFSLMLSPAIRIFMEGRRGESP
jgi:hypothetical protein